MKQTEEWNTAKSRIENQIKELRHRLHTCPEISGQERKTKAALKQFLEESTNLELHDCGGGFYAVYRSSTADSAKKGVAFRADYDALALPEGGAAPCCELFDKEEIEEIYGAHNLPGFAFGELYTKEGTFACGSEGLTLRFIGKPTHAAYPELGVSPAPAVGQILTGIPSFLNKKEHGYSGMALCTVIGVQMGEKAFGAAAEKAEVWLTLRAERGADLKKLRQMVLTRAEELAAQDGLILETEEQDVFPATENDSACAKKVLKVCGGRILQEPMRWSEDFGHYLNHCRGAFFGIGAGVEHPGLHTETYEYPDGLLMRTAESFLKLL